MASRPRRSAATKAKEVISVHARLADSPERSTMSSRRASGRASGASHTTHRNMTVKVSNNSLRQSARGGRAFEGGEIVEGKRNRGARKSYVVDSSPEEDEEEEDEIEVEEDDDDEMDEDAEGEEEIDMDAEGEEDAEGDIEMDLAPPPPTIKVSKPTKSKPAPRPSASKVVPDDDDDDDEDDDDDLSDPADSDIGDHTMGMDETMVDDEDAEGEEIEVAGEDVDDDDEEEVDSEDEGSQDGVDMTKLTKRQRARFEEEPQQYMKLSDGMVKSFRNP
ncbi:hypothetical protein B0J13DRAFT_274454 [Dactylonectria estremocensis]|uniref:Uncharacterized protein n=1 Tax=Dactylonectria estremocensis TaxID=1079267 RepID=A0A9P9JB66_9HYPO|nr:hypothetical protein B0J13DRAFT_274454 [Dactylonectria estremocensis]